MVGVIALTPSASADLELMRASLLLASDPAAAARRASGILAEHPGHEPAKLLLAAACRRIGDTSTAVRLLESLAAEDPGSAVMPLELGRAHAAGGDLAAAQIAFARAVAIDAGLADGWRELANARFAVDDTAGGDVAYAQYRRLAQDPPELTDAKNALAENRLDAAETLLRSRLGQMPDDVVALRVLADIVGRRDDHAQAQQLLTHCLRLAPGDAAARFDLSRALQADQKYAEALEHIERLLVLEPMSTEYRSQKAQALRLLGRHAEAIALMDQAVADRPDEERGWLLHGHLLREVGAQACAIDSYRRAIAVRPGCGSAYLSLANLKIFRFEAEDITAMQALLAAGAVQGVDRMNLEFALGKALEDERRYAESFGHYASANSMHRSMIVHDAQGMTDNVRRSKALYTPEFFEKRRGWGSDRSDPIFVVGLPRSGSTLLEQILASHSQVEGTRELPDMHAVVVEMMLQSDPHTNARYPDPVAALDRCAIEVLAARYLERTHAHRTLDRPRFVDKLLGNFDHIGFIHLMFPKASIIDARRHPLACGFSCFKQLFARGLSFSYDLAEFGRYYRDYAELMAHTDEVLPGRVHRVHYERMVADPEGEVRRLLDYCGLPFEDDCLRFYDNRRTVRTISSEQVRQPIYTGSVDQWRHFEPWLGPLKGALGDWVERYPASRA